MRAAPLSRIQPGSSGGHQAATGQTQGKPGAAIVSISILLENHAAVVLIGCFTKMSAIGILQVEQRSARRGALGIALLTVAFSINAARGVPPVEIRFCPGSAVHAYPLESQRGIQSLLLHNVVCINHGNSFAVTALELELLHSGKVIDSRKFYKRALKELAEKGVKVQASGMLQLLGFQFCGTNLIP